MKRALVTGAGGFIGRHVATLLRSDGDYRIIGLDVRPVTASLFDETGTVDFTDARATSRSIEDAAPDVVFHLVGAMGGSDDVIWASNVRTTESVLASVRETRPGARVVVIGSAAEYGAVPSGQQPVPETFTGHAVNAYGRAKAEVTRLAVAAAQDAGQHVMVARPFNVIGGGMPDTLFGGAVARRIRAALRAPAPRVIRVGRTTSIRDFVSAADVARGIISIATRGRPGEAYNLCTGEGHSMSELLDGLLALAGERVSVERDEGLLRPGEVDAMVGSPQKSHRELGWRARVPFNQSVRDLWEESAVAV